jgi:hypothetical protein
MELSNAVHCRILIICSADTVSAWELCFAAAVQQGKRLSYHTLLVQEKIKTQNSKYNSY